MKNINITHQNISNFIAKELEGGATPLELLAIKEWVKESKENKRFYDEMNKIDNLYSFDFSDKIDADHAWSKVKNQIRSENDTQKVRSFNIRNLLGYAAAIGILIFASVALFQTNEQLPNLTTSSSGLTYSLNDGSHVRLEANSALSQMNKEERIFTFSGKAEFEVTHNEFRPFQVNIDDVRIKDLGTIFNINALPGNDTVFVNVSEGLVNFFTLTHKGIMLKQGEEGMYIKSKNKFYKRSIDVDNQVLNVSFQNTSMKDVIDHLAYSFRKQVVLANTKVTNCNITVDFSEVSFDEVKEIIEETLNISFEVNGNRLLVSGTGCE